MKHWIKKTLKISLITISSLIALTVIIVGIVVYIVFTPTRLTPIIEQVAKEYIAAELSFSSVELTAISTFPNVNLKIKEGLLRTTVKDSAMLTDTIVSFQSVNVTMNPLDMLFDNKISISDIELENPKIYAFTDTTGRANWDVFRFDSDTTEVSDSSSFSAAVDLKKFLLRDGKLTFDDRSARLFGRLDSLGVSLKGQLSKNSDVDASVSFSRGLFWQDGKLLTNKLNVKLDLDGRYFSDTRILDVAQAALQVNDISISATGQIREQDLELNAAVLSPTLATVVKMLPRDYVSSADKMNARGSVSIGGIIKGKYKNDTLPTAEIAIKINDGGFHYKDFQYGIDKLNFDAIAFVDINNLANSKLEIKHLFIDGDALKMTLSGNVSDILGQNRFTAKTDMALDFEKLAKTIPMTQGMNISGKARFVGDFRTSVGQITAQHWKQVILKGRLDMENLSFLDTVSNTSFNTSLASVALDHTIADELSVNGTFEKLFLAQGKLFAASLGHAQVKLSVLKSDDSLKNYVKGNISYKDLTTTLFDNQVRVHSSASDIAMTLKKLQSRLRFRTDTLRIETAKSNMLVSHAGVNLTVGKELLRGVVNFRNIDISTPFFPLAISVDSTLVKVDNNKISLSNAQIKVGRSDIQMSGSVENFLSVNPNDKIIVRGDIKSRVLNLNQIIRAMDAGAVYTNQVLGKYFTSAVDTTATSDDDSDAPLPVIAIPLNIDADLTAEISRLRFSDYKFSDAHGRMMMRDGKAIFRDLGVTSVGSRLNVNTQYAYLGGDSAVVNAAVYADSLGVNTIKAFMPSIDSVFPMINDLSGVVGIEIYARSPMSKVLIPDLDKIDLVVDLYGENIAITNNPTFQSMAKMLMFKQKQENSIDSIHVQAVAQSGKVDILPFLIEIDRYRLAASGIQYMDGRLDYHVSVLKSPIPFKLGVNVTGTFDEFKIAIGKTLLKNAFPLDAPIRQSNSRYIQMRDSIMLPLNINKQ